MSTQKFILLEQRLKEARDNAYLCKYELAIQGFKQVINMISQSFVLENISRNEIEVFKKIQTVAKSQCRCVQNIINALDNFGHPRKVQSYSFEEQEEEQIIKKTVSNFRTTTKALSSAKQRKPFKDPDVWQPPAPIRPVLKKTSMVHNNQSGFQPRESKNTEMRNKNRNINLSKKKQKDFLHDRYPDGKGPDSNLIQMLQREVMDKKPNITFDDIAELETAKSLLQESVLLPLKMPQFFKGIRRAWKGVLMFGPPGTGKTLLAKAVAASGGTTFFNVSASSLASKWKGQSQKLVRILFEMAKFYAPSVIFFDEIDALGSKRKQNEDQSNRKVKTELLVQMDGAAGSQNQQNKFVIVLAATNRPWDLDEALRRRLQKRIYIPLPSEQGRRELLKICLKNVEIDSGTDLEFVVEKTKGYSGADITNICREAAYMPMRKKLKKAGGVTAIQDIKKFEQEINIPLVKQDFIEALKNVNKSVGQDDLKRYQKWMDEFGSV